MTLFATALMIALLSVGLTLLKIQRDLADAALGSSLLTVGGAVLISVLLTDERGFFPFLGSSRLLAYYAPLALGGGLALVGLWLTLIYVRRYRRQRKEMVQRLNSELERS
mgnify:CR=1 FL=1